MSNKCYNKFCNDHDDENNKCDFLRGINLNDELKDILKVAWGRCEARKAFNRILKAQYPKDPILPDAMAINRVGTKFLKEYGYKFGKPHPPIIELEKTNGDMEF